MTKEQIEQLIDKAYKESFDLANLKVSDDTFYDYVLDGIDIMKAQMIKLLKEDDMT